MKTSATHQAIPPPVGLLNLGGRRSRSCRFADRRFGSCRFANCRFGSCRFGSHIGELLVALIRMRVRVFMITEYCYPKARSIYV